MEHALNMLRVLETCIFIKLGEFEFLHQKELHNSACRALFSWVFTAEVVKLLYLKG